MIAPEEVESLLKEKRVIVPPENFKAQANIKDETVYKRAKEDLEAFWAENAEKLHWYKKWDKVLEWNLPYAKWFLNGKINACYNCLDRHIKEKGNKAAIIWEGELGESRVLTYIDLYREVNKFANVLKELGVNRNDIVTIYMPMIPELVIAMLACARIGVPHSVVFSGFSATALQVRINDAGSRFLITIDGYYRRGNVINAKEIVDEAIKNTSIEKVIIFKRVNNPINFVEGRDLWWNELMKNATLYCEPVQADSEDLLFIMYTSGTTGKPKGVMHTTGGYMVGVNTTTRWIFDLKDNDIFWCTADIGWVTGHSYIVYGPLSNAATVLIYEGAPDYPSFDRFWEIIEKYKVTVFYTAPTAIRTFIRWGDEWIKKHDLSSLRLLGTVGEPINPDVWMWYYKTIGNSNCPVVDTWWQTETGMALITPLPGITKLKPGSATFPFPGIEADVLDEEGNPMPPNEKGYLVIKTPWPAMLRGLYKDPERYIETYWSKYKNVYLTGDGAAKDEEGYFWLMGRIDDVIKVSGHRIGTMEVESAITSHEKVAEAAVVGIPHEIKGEAIFAYVILKEGVQETKELEDEIKEHVKKTMGPIARPDYVLFVDDLPKTRSGKIMRRILRKLVEGGDIGDTTTLRDPSVVDDLREKVKQKFAQK